MAERPLLGGFSSHSVLRLSGKHAFLFTLPGISNVSLQGPSPPSSRMLCALRRLVFGDSIEPLSSLQLLSLAMVAARGRGKRIRLK